MKAKVIKTGEIVNVVPTEGGWVADFGDHIRHYTDPELDFEFADWEKFRREAAKDILSALCSFPPINYKEDVRRAINIADELIKQLKEDEK